MPTPLTSDQLLEVLQWRFATRDFDPTRKIPADAWTVLEEVLVLTPSSYGLQPWRFYVIENESIRRRLPDLCFGQRQPVDASHLVVFTARIELNIADVDRYLDRITRVRGTPREKLAGLKRIIMQTIDQPQEGFSTREWNIRQVYIALGNFITAAATLGIDTSPMEGIQASRIDELIGCREEGYETIVLCAAGYRKHDDPYGHMAKVRFETSDVVVRR